MRAERAPPPSPPPRPPRAPSAPRVGSSAAGAAIARRTPSDAAAAAETTTASASGSIASARRRTRREPWGDEPSSEPSARSSHAAAGRPLAAHARPHEARDDCAAAVGGGAERLVIERRRSRFGTRRATSANKSALRPSMRRRSATAAAPGRICASSAARGRPAPTSSARAARARPPLGLRPNGRLEQRPTPSCYEERTRRVIAVAASTDDGNSSLRKTPDSRNFICARLARRQEDRAVEAQLRQLALAPSSPRKASASSTARRPGRAAATPTTWPVASFRRSRLRSLIWSVRNGLKATPWRPIGPRRRAPRAARAVEGAGPGGDEETRPTLSSPASAGTPRILRTSQCGRGLRVELDGWCGQSAESSSARAAGERRAAAGVIPGSSWRSACWGG